MSAELQVAVTNEALELSHMFRQNAALKHGIPDCHGAERISKAESPEPVIVQTAPAPEPAPAVDKSPSPGLGAAQPAQQASLLRRAAPFLATAAVAAGVPLLALWHPNSNSAPPAAPPSVVQPSTSTDGSLLQWLQDKGEHLPEGSWPLTK